MIKQISNTVQCHRSLTASGYPLDCQDPIFCIADDRILFFLDRLDNVFQFDIAVASKLLLEYLIINLDIALKRIDHLSAANLVLPFGEHFSLHTSCRCIVISFSLIIIIKQTGYRCPPVIDQRKLP